MKKPNINYVISHTHILIIIEFKVFYVNLKYRVTIDSLKSTTRPQHYHADRPYVPAMWRRSATSPSLEFEYFPVSPVKSSPNSKYAYSLLVILRYTLKKNTRITLRKSKKIQFLTLYKPQSVKHAAVVVVSK